MWMIGRTQFITVVVASNSFFLHRVCRDRHGCNVVSKCIDKAAGDEQLLNSLAAAVCTDAVALAEHGYGYGCVLLLYSYLISASTM